MKDLIKQGLRLGSVFAIVIIILDLIWSDINLI